MSACRILGVIGLAASCAAPASAAWPPPVPRRLVMSVRETAGVARSGEVVRSGVPLARRLNVTSTAALAVVNASGVPVPAEFRVLARWNAGLLTTSAPIQWLLVAFPATVGANGTARYRLVLDGSAGPNPAPATPLTLTQNSGQVTVDTGVARFVVGGAASALFDEVRAEGVRVVSASALSGTIAGAATTHAITRALTVEHSGPLTAVVVVDGEYDRAAIGSGGPGGQGRIGSLRRYVFTAGSPTAIVRQVAQWEGTLCNAEALTCGSEVNAVRVEGLRDALTLDLGSPLAVTAIGDAQAAALQGTATVGQEAWVRQLQRADRLADLAFEVSVPGTGGAGGDKADGALLSASGANGAVAVALNHMHRYEPQALRLLADGRLAVDLADGPSWLASYQGLFTTLAVGALPSSPSVADLRRRVWAPLNHPLRAWPSPEWFASSEAVDEFPVGPLPPELAPYDTLVQAVLDDTMGKVDSVGLNGLMTFGLFPRQWGWAVQSDEVECGGDDPTPAEDWDDTFFCSTWTDYHNTSATAAIRALRTGEVQWLDEIGTPAALRTLHTQILQCSPQSTWFYCGQAPMGYGAYRTDNNASHAYFDNLILHYWLTGDITIVRTLRRGAETMRRFMCDLRGGGTPLGPTCPPDRPKQDPWAELTGRVANQWYSVFRLLGLASDDPTFLDDWKTNLARWMTLFYMQPVQGGRAVASLMVSGGSTDYVPGPGTYWSDQLWMASLYDFNQLYRLEKETQNAALGLPAVTPAAAQAAWARMLAYGAAVSNPWSGGAAGVWPNSVRVTFTGPRVGGTLTAFLGDPDPNGNGTPCEINEPSEGEVCLYNTGKATLPAVLARAGDGNADPALRALAADLTTFTLGSAQFELQPLGKNMGEYLSRLHPAVARLAQRRFPRRATEDVRR